MNFLEICKNIRLLSGAQGVGPVSVVNPEGYEEALVSFARDGYISIQNLREDFKFLRSTHEGFTEIGTEDYKHGVKSIVRYTPKISVDNRWKLLKEVEYREAEERFMNRTSGEPRYYSLPHPNTIRLYPTPDIIYSMKTEVQENPEILMTDAQVPKLPIAFHKLIVYKGLESFSVFLGSPEIYRQYSAGASQLEQKLMSMEVPQKTIRSPRFCI